MNCPTCQVEMLETATSFVCQTILSNCGQPPICKGCLQPMTSTGAPIWDYYCENKDCKRNPLDNLRDLMKDVRLPETQASVHAWTSDVYSQYNSKGRRAIALIEEAIELGIAAGLSEADIQNVVQVPLQKFATTGDRGNDGEELGDVLLCVYAYGGQVKIDAHGELNKKMAKNRSHPKAYFQAKFAKKLDFGLDMAHPPETNT